MPITSLEIKDKTFSTKFRGFNPEEVDEFLDSLKTPARKTSNLELAIQISNS